MASNVPPGPHRTLSGVDPPGDIAASDVFRAAGQAIGYETLTSSADRSVSTPFAFVIFAAIELAFVFGLLVCTKLEPSQVLQITGAVTGISVAGFFGRNAAIVIGRRMIAGPDRQ